MYCVATALKKIMIYTRKKNLHACPLVKQNTDTYSVSTVHFIVPTCGLFAHANVMKSYKMLPYSSLLPYLPHPYSWICYPVCRPCKSLTWKKYVLQIFSTFLDPGLCKNQYIFTSKPAIYVVGVHWISWTWKLLPSQISPKSYVKGNSYTYQKIPGW